jgi:hypothetical protein
MRRRSRHRCHPLKSSGPLAPQLRLTQLKLTIYHSDISFTRAAPPSRQGSRMVTPEHRCAAPGGASDENQKDGTSLSLGRPARRG